MFGFVATLVTERLTSIIVLFLAKFASFERVSMPSNLMRDLNYIPKRDRGTDDFSVRALSPVKPGV